MRSKDTERLMRHPFLGTLLQAVFHADHRGGRSTLVTVTGRCWYLSCPQPKGCRAKSSHFVIHLSEHFVKTMVKQVHDGLVQMRRKHHAEFRSLFYTAESPYCGHRKRNYPLCRSLCVCYEPYGAKTVITIVSIHRKGSRPKRRSGPNNTSRSGRTVIVHFLFTKGAGT